MKNLLKLLCFGAVLIVLLEILSLVFNGGDLAAQGSVIYYDRRIAELSNEQEGQIDVLCVGNSLCGAGFCSPSLYRDYGITSYNAGKEMQKPVETYYCIKEAIEKQPIKVSERLMERIHGDMGCRQPWDTGFRFSNTIHFGSFASTAEVSASISRGFLWMRPWWDIRGMSLIMIPRIPILIRCNGRTVTC